ncbi:hypothetical protein V6N11_006711 [Hibiscus sabdariffa]|uniref:Uncharacterized protein n=2 Tax=Hibiscus sabdariffa TaxID=183260 RepID=A0ABR1ZLF9_9ROSI
MRQVTYDQLGNLLNLSCPKLVSSTTPTATTVSVVPPTQPSHAHVDSHAADTGSGSNSSVEVVAKGTINGTDLADVSVSESTGPADCAPLVGLVDLVVSSNEVDHAHVASPTSTSDATNVLAASMHLHVSTTPLSVHDAIADPKWSQAVLAEFHALQANDT